MFNGKPAQVLVVDDEPALRELLTDALEGSEYHVRSAGSGKQALELVRQLRPDILVTDMCLGDSTGLEIIDALRSQGTEVPAVVITGHRDPGMLTEATQRRPVEVLLKPLDLSRLKSAIEAELHRQVRAHRHRSREDRLRKLARSVNHKRRYAQKQLDTTCVDLTTAYQTLSGQMSVQQALIQYQNELVGSRNDDDAFRALFRLFVQRSGAVFGVAMVCNDDAELQISGRFGVPQPDSAAFCQELVKPVVSAVLADPKCHIMDAGDEADLFATSIRRYLPGVSVLAIPLLPSDQELIGLVVLYRKGEQPFTDVDLELAELVSMPTALAVRRNE